MIMYKIRNRETGLYSTGGMKPNWSKDGKTWGKGHVGSHLRQFIGHGFRDADIDFYANAEIVQIEVKEEELKTHDVLDYLEEKNQQDLREANNQTNPSTYQLDRLKSVCDRIAYLKTHKEEF